MNTPNRCGAGFPACGTFVRQNPAFAERCAAGKPTAKGQAGKPAPQSLRRGLGLVELLVALSISASVLVAVAAAVNASFKAYSINEEQARLNQAGRLAMHRIISQIRLTNAHQPITAAPLASFRAGSVVVDNGIDLFTEDNHELRFTYNSTTKQVMAIDALNVSHVLLRGVQSFQIKFEPMRSQTSIKTGGVYDQLLRATVQVTLVTDTQAPDVDEVANAQTITLSASVVPRRNIW